MKTKLKPCPFCGTRAVAPKDRPDDRVDTYKNERGCWHVACYSCMTTTNWYDTENQAIKAWNRRTEVTDE